MAKEWTVFAEAVQAAAPVEARNQSGGLKVLKWHRFCFFGGQRMQMVA
jgi:hypothetical protein